jgi:2-phosphoglycerate kinase
MYITKKNGNVVLYDTEKIINSILKANGDTDEEELSRATASYIANETFDRLTKEKDIITTQDIRECVYDILCGKNLPKTAQLYMDFHK